MTAGQLVSLAHWTADYWVVMVPTSVECLALNWDSFEVGAMDAKKAPATVHMTAALSAAKSDTLTDCWTVESSV